MSLVQASRLLCKLLVTTAYEELSIDLHRQSLCQEIGFHPLKAFVRIKDIKYESDKMWIDAHDLHVFLHKNYHEDIKLVEWADLVHYFDSDSGITLDFDDFLRILLPCQDKELRSVMKRSKYNLEEVQPGERILSQDCEILLASLFKREIDMNRTKNQLIEDISSVYEVNPLQLFKLIDIDDMGYISHVSIKEFCNYHNNFLTEQELLAIVRRIDTDGDLKISYEDFVQFITPNTPHIK